MSGFFTKGVINLLSIKPPLHNPDIVAIGKYEEKFKEEDGHPDR